MGTFIDTSELSVVAPFKQQHARERSSWPEVEMVFKSHPGRLFRGKVDAILEATGEGQGAVSGTLPSASKIGSAGVLAVKVVLNEDEPADKLDISGLRIACHLYRYVSPDQYHEPRYDADETSGSIICRSCDFTRYVVASQPEKHERVEGGPSRQRYERLARL